MYYQFEGVELLTYDFENVKEPLYEYVYNCIKKDISSGNLKSGDKLPSKRSFAKNNGVSVITVQNAYDQLISEGYIFSLPRKGYYVAEVPNMLDFPRAKGSKTKPLNKGTEYEADLSGNVIDTDNFPFSVWAKTMRRVISQKRRELLTPSPAAGTEELRLAIAEHLRSFRGIQASAEQIVVGAGAEELYGILIRLLGKGKRYCVENPGYKKLSKIYSLYGVDFKPAAMDKSGIKISELEKAKAQVAHISPTHHFPTGITMPVGRRYEILSWANTAEGRYVVEDDYDSEFRQNGRPVPALFSIDACEKVIYMNTFSKSLAPTIRVGYMVLPEHLAELFGRNFSFSSCAVSNFEQCALAEFIAKGFFEKHINRMRLYYGRRRREIINCVRQSRLNDFCEIIENDSGLHFLLEIKTTVGDGEITEYLRKNGIRLEAISDYYITARADDSHRFLINYSNVDINALAKTLELLYQFLKRGQIT